MKHRCAPWTTTELAAVMSLRVLILDLVVSYAEQLSALNAELLASNEELDAFAFVASHDLKEPLRGIHRHASLLISDLQKQHALDDSNATRLQSLLRLTVRMDDLLDALLHFSRVGRLELQRQPEDMNVILQESLEMVGPLTHETDCDVRVADFLPVMVSDRVRVREIFTNLISNGIKYNNKPNRWVEIGTHSIGNGDCTEMKVPPLAQGQTIFYVRDNGIGIPPRHHDQIFGMFKRLHARDAFGGGSGAGLTIVRRLVERHGGVVWFSSEVDVGSTFYFTLSSAERYP